MTTLVNRQILPDKALPGKSRERKRRILPGLPLTLGFTIAYLSLIVLIPLSTAYVLSAGMSWEGFKDAAFSARAIDAYKVTLSTSAIAAVVNAVFGILLTWVLVRYRFPGRRIVDGLIDLPFALPTAVAGIALCTIYAPNGWMGSWLYPLGIQSAYSKFGITLALIFVGLPFVVRTVQPVLEDFDKEQEEASATLGASPFITFFKVILPALLPAVLAGFAMAFARAIGEYGSVIFISGGKISTEIVPQLIVAKLEEFDYPGATAISVVMLTTSFVLLLLINLLQRWVGRRTVL